MNIKERQTQAQNREYIDVLTSLSVVRMDKFLKRWDRKTYKVYHIQSKTVQMLIVCKEVVRLKEHFEDTVINFAEAFIKKNEVKKQ